MALTCLSGTKSSWDPLVSQLLDEWVASSPLPKFTCYEAAKVAQLPLIRNKQIVAVKQYASVLFPAPELIGLLMDLKPQGRLPACVEVHDPPGVVYTAATGLPSPRPIPSRDRFRDKRKELVKPLALDLPVSAADPPTSGRSWPLQSWARYVQSRASLVGTIDWKRPLTFLLRGAAYPCAGGSWTQLPIGPLNHGAWARTPAYLWVIRMAIGRDKDMAALATKWSKNLQVSGCFVSLSFLCKYLKVNISYFLHIDAD